MKHSEPLALVKLTTLMELTSGRPEILVGLLDRPATIQHPDLVSQDIVSQPVLHGLYKHNEHWP